MLAGLVLWITAGCNRGDDNERFHRTLLEINTGALGMRDAAIRGDLHEARSLAGKMIERLPAPTEAKEPEEIAALRLALSDIRGAPTAQDASLGVGKLTAVCARCHAAAHVALPAPDAQAPSPGDSPVRDEMARHAAAVNALWVGIVGGNESTVLSAIDTLQRDALSPGEHVPWQTAALDREAHALAENLRQQTAEQRPEGYGALLAACTSCHLAMREPSLPKIAGIALPNLAMSMNDHFLSAFELQLAVMGGDLEGAKSAAKSLEAPADPPTPGMATAYYHDVRIAASRVGAATSILDAAQATADLQIACANCHVASGGGPTEVVPEAPTEPHLAVHLYGAVWMGYGLLAPDERAWVQGSTALGRAPLLPDDFRPAPGTEALDAPLHLLAQRASLISTPGERAAIWAEVMASCAPCHQQMKH